MKKKSQKIARIGYLGILASYLILLTSFILFCFILETPNKIVLGACLGVALLLLFISIQLTTKEILEEKTNIDKILKFLCALPLFIIFLPLALIALIFIFIDAFKNSFSRQTKPLRKKGFILSKRKQNKTVVYSFKKENCIVEIIPNASYQISFNDGKIFEKVEDSKLGTIEERNELKDIIEKYNGCDYRDRDIYLPDRHYISFLIRNLS